MSLGCCVSRVALAFVFAHVFPNAPDRNINPDVSFETHNYNITTMENFSHFMDRVRCAFRSSFELPFIFTFLGLIPSLVLSGLEGWRRGRRWTWSSAAWTTLKPGWPSTKWVPGRNSAAADAAPRRTASQSALNLIPILMSSICRLAMNWVRPGWSRASVRTPCRDTFSSSSPERRRVSL